MTLLLFHHGNSFESIYQSSGAIRHIALKIKSGSFHQFTAVYEDREKSQAVTAINFRWLSKHASPALTASRLTLGPVLLGRTPRSARWMPGFKRPWKSKGHLFVVPGQWPAPILEGWFGPAKLLVTCYPNFKAFASPMGQLGEEEWEVLPS